MVLLNVSVGAYNGGRSTKQECEMVLLIADGLTYKEIAQELQLSVYKVKTTSKTSLKKWY
ncbi:LuxR C-terminal-related transcriptional regulator [Candidatus Latescibacterota bacterium]